MEPVGLAVGVLGLAGLFNSCLEALDRIQSYRSSAEDASTLDIHFNVAKDRFNQWGRLVGIKQGLLLPKHHPDLDDERKYADVSDVLQKIIKAICDESLASSSRLATNNPAIASHRSHRYQRPPSKSRKTRLIWAWVGKKRRTEQVKTFKDLVEDLHSLVNPRETYETLAPGLAKFPIHSSRDKAATRRELHAWLGLGFPNERYYDSLHKRLRGTCNWIFDRPEFLQWLSPEHSGDSNTKLLWINGPTGFGKTIICASIVERLSSTLKTPVGHYFFSSELGSCQDPFLAIRSWISQVASENKGAYELVLEKWEADTDPILSRASAVALFSRILHAIPGCIFVADGLDECVFSDLDRISVKNFVHNVVDAVSGTDSRVLLVSCDEPAIRRAVTGFTEYKMLLQDVYADAIALSCDIVSRKLPNKDDGLRLILSRAMANQCEGQLIWLSMQENSLRRGMNKKQLLRAIEETPVALERLYDKYKRRIMELPAREQNRTFALLRWATFALRPLTVCEITEAVLIGDYEDLPLDEFPDDVDNDYIDSEIIDFCSPLLIVSDEISAGSPGKRTVSIPHFSVRKYLLCNILTTDWTQKNYDLNRSYEKVQNTLLAKACLQYIQYRQVWTATLDYQDGPPLGASFRDYAATSWHHHVNSGLSDDAEISKLAIGFLSKHNPTWVNWRSLIELHDSRQEYRRAETNLPGPLYYSVKLQLMDVSIALLADQSCDINEHSGLGSALGIACSNGAICFVTLLLKNGAKATLVDKEGRFPIHMASKGGHTEVVKLLLENETATASSVGSTESTLRNVVVEGGTGATARDASYKTPLHYSVLYSWVECVRLLLHQCKKMTMDVENMTALHYTVSNTSEQIAQCFLDAGVSIDIGVVRQTWLPICHEGTVRYFLNNDDTPDFGMGVNENLGLTALHYAALTGNKRMTMFFLDHGANPNIVSEYGETSLHLALKRDLYGKKWPGNTDHWNDPIYRIESALDSIEFDPEGDVEYSKIKDLIELHRLAVIFLLLDHSSTDVNVRDMYGASPLHDAFHNNKYLRHIIKRLIGRGADVSARNSRGQTPLHLACLKGDVQSVQEILSCGVDITAHDSEGVSAIHYAAQSGNIEVMSILFTYAAGVNHVVLRDKHKRNALHHLITNVEHVNCLVLQCLFDKGVDVNGLDDTGMSPLAMYLTEFLHFSDNASAVVGLFLVLGSNPLFKTVNEGLNLAHLHAGDVQIKLDILEVLASFGVDLQARDYHGRTILHHCAMAGSLITKEALHFLCDKVGLVKEMRDAHGKTPCQYAAEMKRKKHHPDIYGPGRWSRTEKLLLGMD